MTSLYPSWGESVIDSSKRQRPFNLASDISSVRFSTELASQIARQVVMRDRVQTQAGSPEEGLTI